MRLVTFAPRSGARSGRWPPVSYKLARPFLAPGGALPSPVPLGIPFGIGLLKNPEGFSPYGMMEPPSGAGRLIGLLLRSTWNSDERDAEHGARSELEQVPATERSGAMSRDRKAPPGSTSVKSVR